MGTVFRFAGNSELGAEVTQNVIARATEVLHEADEIFSLYKPESPLSRLARGETRVADLDPVVGQIWDDCESWSKQTDGWFSAFTPEHTFDPSGLVKAWAANRAALVLLDSGIADFTLNAGGDVFIAPGASNDADWRVAISTPVSIASAQAGVLTVVDLKDTAMAAVATSGTAERGDHIWNPKTYGQAGAPAGSNPNDQLVQVSVLAGSLIEADVLATAAFAEGIAAVDRLNARPNVEALFVTIDGRFAATDGFLNLLAK